MKSATKQMLMLTLVLFAGAASCLFAWQQQNTVLHAAIGEIQQREIVHTQKSLDSFFANANHFLARAARDPRLLEMIHTGAQPDVVHELAENKAVYGFSEIMFHDRAGEMLYLSDAPSRPGEFYGAENYIQKQYSDNPQPMAEISLRGKPTLIFSHPVRQDNVVTGVMMLTFTLDEVLLQQLSDLTRNALRLHFADGRDLAVGDAGEKHALEWPVGADLTSSLMVQVPLSIPTGASPILLWAFLGLVIFIGLSAMLSYWQSQKRQEADFNQFVYILEQADNASAALIQASQRKDSSGRLATALHHILHKYGEQKLVSQNQIDQLHKSNESLHEQLNHAHKDRDAAVHAPRIKSEFLSRMGDEITTPMNSLMGMLQLLSEHNMPKEEKELLLVALRSARLLTANLNNILDFAKLDAHLLSLKKQPFIVKELVDSIIAEYEDLASEKQLRLSRNISFDVPEQVLNDESRIRQILGNLVGNAVRFTKEGEIGVYVDLWEKEGRKLLRFTISDTGLGIPKEAQAGLFDSLDSRSRLTNASFAGRLRLIVCRQLSDLLGGEIGLSSEVGKGSRFWFTTAI